MRWGVNKRKNSGVKGGVKERNGGVSKTQRDSPNNQ